MPEPRGLRAYASDERSGLTPKASPPGPGMFTRSCDLLSSAASQSSRRRAAPTIALADGPAPRPMQQPHNGGQQDPNTLHLHRSYGRASGHASHARCPPWHRGTLNPSVVIKRRLPEIDVAFHSPQRPKRWAVSGLSSTPVDDANRPASEPPAWVTLMMYLLELFCRL